MKTLARFFAALSGYFEARAAAQHLVAKVSALETQMVEIQRHLAQVRVEVAKCKLVVGLNQVTDVTPAEV